MLNKFRFCIVFVVLIGVPGCHLSPSHQESLPRDPLSASTDGKVDSLLRRMTLDEKITLIGGIDSKADMIGGDLMGTRSIPRLEIPALKMTDGPIGVRNGPNTAFPSGINLGATFDPDLVHEVAEAIADEARLVGKNMLLGPCVNIARSPLGGRNFESFGEDPYLNAQYAKQYVLGLQSRGVAGSLKHWALNEQETNRDTIDTIVDKRTMHELHFPAFKAGVDAGVLSVMSAFNKVNGAYASESDYLLNQVIKKDWGYKGFVISDWQATHSTIESANNGLDLEMPLPDYYAPEKILAAIQSGKILPETIDDKVRRILRTIVITSKARTEPALGPRSVEHKALARRVAQESLVLLKNKNDLLPLKPSVRSLALIGPNATELQSGGGGSSRVVPAYSVQPLDAFRRRLPGIKIRHSVGSSMPRDREPLSSLVPSPDSAKPGLRVQYFASPDFKGPAIKKAIDQSLFYDPSKARELGLPDKFSVRWTGFFQAPETGQYLFTTESHEGDRLWINNKLVIDQMKSHHRIPSRAEVRLMKGKWYPIRIESFNTTPNQAYYTIGWSRPYPDRIRDAADAARGADVAIVFAGVHESLEGEGIDRSTLELPVGQADLIRAVSAANPNTIVVLNGGGAFAMSSWLNGVRALIHAFYPGQEGGDAIVDLIMGDVNPSGKLPLSFPKKWEDSAVFGHFPGDGRKVEYKEGIFVGYRWHDKRQIEPLYPFGHGLSYTKFNYSNLSAQMIDAASRRFKVEFDISNVGAKAGVEVAQLYVGEQKPSLPRPPRELKGFKRVSLAPGETKRVSILLDSSSFAYYDADSSVWNVNPGKFELSVGSSSRDLRLKTSVDVIDASTGTP